MSAFGVSAAAGVLAGFGLAGERDAGVFVVAAGLWVVVALGAGDGLRVGEGVALGVEAATASFVAEVAFLAVRLAFLAALSAFFLLWPPLSLHF